MKKDRDAMYYGMGTYSMFPYQMQNPYQNMINSEDIENRLQRIERQIRRLDIRLSKLESPYMDTQKYQISNSNDYPFKSDNSMYMM